MPKPQADINSLPVYLSHTHCLLTSRATPPHHLAGSDLLNLETTIWLSSVYLSCRFLTYLEGFCNWWCNLVCMCVQNQIQALGIAGFRCRIKPRLTSYPGYLVAECQSKKTHQSGSLWPALACIASWCLILITCSLYLPSWYISSARSLLKEQHIPWSVGCILKIAAQLRGFPLHKHFFNSPSKRPYLRNKNKFS